MAVISTEFESLYQIRYYLLGPEIEAIYGLKQLVVSDPFEGKIGIAPVSAEFEGVIPNSLKVEFEGLQGYRYKINTEQEGLYRIRDTTDVSTEFEGVVKESILAKEFTAEYGIVSKVESKFEVKYQLVTSVITEFEVAYDIVTYNFVTTEFKAVQQYTSALGGSIVNSSSPPFVEFSGIRMGIVEADIAHDESGYLWEATIRLGHISDYAKVAQDERFILDIYGEQYQLLVDAKEMSRTAPAVVTSSLVGLSPTALLDFPRADPHSKTWDTPVYASVAVADAVGTIQWDLVDWEIPAYRLVYEDVAPIEVAQELAEVAGGTIETLPDGSLVARHVYPVPVPDFNTTTPDHVLTEVDDIRQLQEQFVPSRLYNRFLITDNANLDYADRIEFEVDEFDPKQGILRVFLSPWRDDYYLESSNVAMSWTTKELVTDTWPPVDEAAELVEIFDGEGSTQYPIWGLVDVDYESINVSPLTWTEGSESITTAGDANKYGLFYLRYTRKYYKYSIFTSELPSAAQIILVDTSEE